MIGVFKGFTSRPTAVLVHDKTHYQHEYGPAKNYESLEFWTSTVEVIAYKELCQW